MFVNTFSSANLTLNFQKTNKIVKKVIKIIEKTTFYRLIYRN